MPSNAGSITLSVTVDDKSINRSVSEISSKFGEMGVEIDRALATGDTKTAKLINNFRKLTEQEQKQIDKVNELKDRLAQLQEIQSMEAQGDTLAKGFSGKTEDPAYDNALSKIEELYARADAARQNLSLGSDVDVSGEIANTEAELQSASIKLQDVSIKAQEAGENLKSMGNSGEDAGKRTNSGSATALSGVEKLGKRVIGLAKRVFVFSVITKAFRALRGAVVDYIKSDSQLNASLQTLKASFADVGTRLMDTMRPAIQWILEKLTVLASLLSTVLTTWFGKSAKAANKLGGEVKKTGNEAKKAAGSLAAFDEVTTLSGGGEDTSGGDTAAATELPAAPVGDFDTSKITDKMGELMTFIGGALVALGVILMFFGHPALGIGAIIAGITVFSVGEAALNDEDPTEKTKKMLSDLMAVVGLSLAAIGILLMFFGKFLLGGGALIAGVTMLGFSAASENPGVMQQKIKQFMQDNAGMIVGVSAFLLVLGILLCIAGLFPIGLGLIFAGAAGIVGAIAFNWDALVNKFKDLGNKIKKVFSSVWDAIKKGFKAMVNGIIWYANLWINGLNALLAPIRLIIVGVAKAFGKKVSMSTVRIPNIPYLAKGGVVPYATLAMVGERGREAVLPLENNTEWMDTLADKVINRMGGTAPTRIEVPVIINGREIARATRDAEARMGKQTVFGGFANAY